MKYRKKYRCSVCGKKYSKIDDSKSVRCEHHDGDWNPKDGRCYFCFLDMLVEIYGDWMEPVFILNGFYYDAGPCTPRPIHHIDDEDIPF